MNKLLVFDIWGNYAHYKQIYATTSAISYPIPFKTAIYGYVSAILGFNKIENNYLKYFQDGNCKIGLQLLNEISTTRINTNLRAEFGMLKAGGNRKPTLMEYIVKPKYRIYFIHKNDTLYNNLKSKLISHESYFTPVMGLANLISNFQYITESDFEEIFENEKSINIHTIIPKTELIDFESEELHNNENEVVEISSYAIEMNQEREVTKRDDIIFDRKGKPIKVYVNKHFKVKIENDYRNIILF